MMLLFCKKTPSCSFDPFFPFCVEEPSFFFENKEDLFSFRLKKVLIKKVDDVALPLPSFTRARKKKKDYKSDIRFNKPRVICIK